jgi:hypothetical protein
MVMSAGGTPPVWRLHLGLMHARFMIWLGSVGRDAAIMPEAHLYLASRYDLLAHHYVLRRRYLRARRFARLAADHYRAGGWDGPPPVGRAMPRPARWASVNAVGRSASSARTA